MQLFFAPELTIPRYTLPEEESKHCVRVLRLSAGDTLHITDGKGGMFTARIVNDNPKRCEVEIVSQEREFEKRDYSLTMAVAPTKNTDRFEWFIEKATEIGVDCIIPVECRYSERRTYNTERGNRVIIGAVKQSLKAYVPVLSEITPFEEVVGMPFGGRKLIAHCYDTEKKFITECVGKGDDVLLLIGPEGDFSEEEVALAAEKGFTPVTLGDSRLRSETAALFAVTEISVINQKR